MSSVLLSVISCTAITLQPDVFPISDALAVAYLIERIVCYKGRMPKCHCVKNLSDHSILIKGINGHAPRHDFIILNSLLKQGMCANGENTC